MMRGCLVACSSVAALCACCEAAACARVASLARLSLSEPGLAGTVESCLSVCLKHMQVGQHSLTDACFCSCLPACLPQLSVRQRSHDTRSPRS